MDIGGMNRRRFLAVAGAVAAYAVVPGVAAGGLTGPASTGPAEDFTFLFLTDSHTEPELDGVQGTDLAMRLARGYPADFAIQGGDHVFDALGATKTRATQLFDLYGKTEQDLGLKVYHTLGNHDCFGVYPSSGVGPADPLYGKKMYEDRFGPTFYSFNHKGHHFVVLDSILITPARAYAAGVDASQLAWLRRDLEAQRPGQPIIIITHSPLYSTANTLPSILLGGRSVDFALGAEVRRLFVGRNILGVLQGHIHINDRITLEGITYQTCGAICGNWWHGPRLGTPEGFTVVRVSGGKLTTSYIPSGFHSVAPELG
jgi:Icc protein